MICICELTVILEVIHNGIILGILIYISVKNKFA